MSSTSTRIRDVYFSYSVSVYIRMGYNGSALYSGTVTLAECVVAWLAATGKKQTVVAEKAGLLPSKLSELATGSNRNPRWTTVEKLAKGFGLSVVLFLAGPRPDAGAGREAAFGGEVGTRVEDYLRGLLAYIRQLEGEERSKFISAIVALFAALEHARPATNSRATAQDER